MQDLGLETAETVPIPGADRFFIADPDGNRIELIEWKEPYINQPTNPKNRNESL